MSLGQIWFHIKFFAISPSCGRGKVFRIAIYFHLIDDMDTLKMHPVEEQKANMLTIIQIP